MAHARRRKQAAQENSEIQVDLNKLKPSQVYLFRDGDQKTSLVEELNRMRLKEQLCDVLLRVDGKKLPAHRSILAAASPYFRDLIVTETGQHVKNIDIPDGINASTMEVLLEYMYLSKMFLHKGNMMDILCAASILELSSLLEETAFSVERMMTADNCLGIYYLSLELKLELLHERSQRFLHREFVEASFGKEFLELSTEKLADILDMDDLHTEAEEDVFESLLRWVDWDRPDRSAHFSTLLQHVRLPLMRTEYLIDRVEKHDLVSRSPAAKEMLMDAMRYHMATPEKRADMASPRTSPRICSKSINALVIAGGKPEVPGCSCMTYCLDPETNDWFTMEPMRSSRYNHSAVSLNDIIYCIGGCVEGETHLQILDEVERLDTRTNTWEYVASLGEPRTQFSSAVLEGNIFSIGGLIEGPSWNAAELYSSTTGKWSFIALPSVPRRCHVIVQAGEYLYAIGGDGMEVEPVISVERYDLVSDTWVFVTPLNCGRRNCCAAVVDGKIYVIGGSDGYRTLKNCEVYDPDKNIWTNFKGMKEFREQAEAVAIGNRIYVTGGYDLNGTRLLTSIEYYDVEQDEWTLLDTQIPVPTHGYKCTTAFICKDVMQPLTNE